MTKNSILVHQMQASMRTLSRCAFLAAAFAALLGTWWGCNSRDEPFHGPEAKAEFRFNGTHPIKTVCTTGMVADLVRHVGGSHVSVTQLMGAGIDPHLYKTSTADIEKLSSADAIFYSGLHLEGKMGDVFVRMARRKPVYPVTEGVLESEILEVGDGQFDPHLWFDVSLWSQCVDVVAEALVSFDPPHADEYKQNAATYRERLAKLHEECKTRIATIPADRRVLVTAHDAFAYFGRAYAMEVKAIQGISTETEAGVKEINDLVDFIAQRKIKAVFIETSVSDRNIKALVEGCQAKGHTVVIGGELFSDAMGEEGTPEGTYEGMVRHNVETIVKALE
jgi:manganese/zinc/iron transport system substrate-binding protein